MTKLSSFFSTGTKEMFETIPHEGWKQRAPAPDNRLAFKFKKQHEEDKRQGVYVISPGSRDGFLVVSFRVEKPLGVFVIKDNIGISIIVTDPFNKLQVQDSDDGHKLEIFDAFDNPRDPKLTDNQVDMVAGLLATAANVARLRNIDRIDEELIQMSGQ